MTLLVLLRGSTSLLPADEKRGTSCRFQAFQAVPGVESCDTRCWKGMEGIVPPILTLRWTNDRDEGRDWASRGRLSVQLLMDDDGCANWCDLSYLDLSLFTR